jgi:DNA-binding transcriptional LysR family regulator
MLRVDHPSVQVESLARVDAVCVLPPGHLLSNRTALEPEDLQDEAFIGLGREDRSGQMISRAFEDRGVTRNIHLETNLSEVACRLVAAGAGVSIVDPFTAGQFEPASLVVKPFRPSVVFEMFLLFPAFRPRSLLLQAFVGALQAEVGNAAVS